MGSSYPMENDDIKFQVYEKLNEDIKVAVRKLYREDGAFFSEFEQKNIHHILFFYKDSLAGHAEVIYQPTNETVVWSLRVKKEFRRKGVFTEFTWRIRRLVGKDDLSILSKNDNPGAKYLAKKYESNIVNANLIMMADSRRCEMGKVSLVEADSDSYWPYFDSIYNIDENAYPYPLSDEYLVDVRREKCFFIVNENSTRIGAFSVEFGNDEDAELAHFCIDEEYRGLGYGEASLNAISSYILEQGAKKIYLITDYANKRAYGLYKKYGFEVVRGLYEYRLP